MKKRLLIITDDPERGGTFRLAERVAIGLSKDFNVCFSGIAERIDEVSRTGLELAGVTIRNCRIMPHQFLHASFSAGYAELLLQDAKPDIIVCFESYCIWSLLALKTTAQRFGIPHYSVVTCLPEEYPAKLVPYGGAGAAVARLGVDCARNAAGLIFVSEAARQAVQREVPELAGPSHVVVNSRPPKFFRRVDPAERKLVRARLGLDDDEVVFLCVARITPQKGQRLCIGAVRTLRLEGQCAKVRLVFAGEGEPSEVDALRRDISTAGLEDSVTMLGYNEDVVSLLAAGDGFVLASYSEGMPLSIIEAMAQGLPVIATNVGGVSQLLGDCGGILVPSPQGSDEHCVSEIAKAMAALAQDQAVRAGYGRAGRERALALFSEEQMIARYLDILNVA